MNKREEVLKEALEKNETDSQRWQTYLKENETAIDNMNMFCKRLTMDVMVPVGKKAFMPGQLLHTNEVLIGHYQGYFSKCTTFKAREICEYRIKMANEYIKKLETEANLWQDKLHKPYTEGVMPSGEEHEIIEEFNEEREKLWKENHRVRIKQAKQKEREEREMLQKQNYEDKNIKEKSNGEILNMLEEAELIEELEHELDAIEVDDVNDETIRKLMSGEMKLPREKSRLAHDKETAEEKLLSPNIVKKRNIKESTQTITNNNIQPNPEIINLANLQEVETDEEIVPEEVALIKEQAKYLNAEDQIGFYDYQIQIIRQKLQLLPLSTQEELIEKINLLNVLEHFEELLEGAEETLGKAELDKLEEDEENDDKIKKQKLLIDKDELLSESCNKKNFDQKRRISFALEDQTLEFRNNEAVTQMLPPEIGKSQRDIIKLDDNNGKQEDNSKLKTENSLSKLELIQAKVEKNLQYVEENQSKRDYDLVQQIIQSFKGDINTLHIKFKHSQQDGFKTESMYNTPCSPADFYDLYTKSQKLLENGSEPSILFVNSYEGEEQVKAPVLKEVDRQSAFVDPKSEFSNPFQTKSILKNKSAVDKENHCENKHLDYNNKTKKKEKKSSKKEEEGYLSAYYKVMNDVIEKPLTEPEPLPDVKFIDAHTPKKRISRFKQMRAGNERT